MKVISYTTKYEVRRIEDILKKNKIYGEEKNLHFMMFGESKVNAKVTPRELEKFISEYCRFWDLKH